MNLYEISEDLLHVIDGGMVVDDDTGEVLFDADNLEELEIAYADKLEACGLYVKNLRAEAEAMRQEENRLAERRRSKEHKAARIRDYMLSSMQRTGTSKLDTAKVAISQRKSNRCIIDDESVIPDRFIKVQRNVDRAAVGRALKTGEVPGAHTEEHLNLQIK